MNLRCIKIEEGEAEEEKEKEEGSRFEKPGDTQGNYSTTTTSKKHSLPSMRTRKSERKHRNTRNNISVTKVFRYPATPKWRSYRTIGVSASVGRISVRRLAFS